MATALMRLSPSEVIRFARRQGTKTRLYHDGGGLYLCVDKRGPYASWVFRYSMHGKARTMGLGPYPATSLAQARRLALEARLRKAEGEDPLERRQRDKAAAWGGKPAGTTAQPGFDGPSGKPGLVPPAPRNDGAKGSATVMRAMVLDGGYGLEHLKLTERPVPTAGPGEVVVRLQAASLNYRDLASVAPPGATGSRPAFVPLSDGAGVVAEVGAGVTRVAVGDLVMPSFFPGWVAGEPTMAGLSSALGGAHDGCARDYIALTAEGVTKAPAGYDARQAACLPCAGLTAWRALVVEGHIKPGDTVLVQGTGGVSIFALQFAKLAGATVIVTSSSDEKLERAKSMGADHLINYRATPEWAKAARAITGGRGVDHVVEVGGAETLRQSFAAARLGGHVAIIGVLSGYSQPISPGEIFSRNLKISGISVGSRTHCEEMVRGIEAGSIKPVIDRAFPLEALPQGLELMRGASHFGKIVIDIA